jgi:uncharacterized OB-fold protein
MAYISIPYLWRTIPQKYRLVASKCKICGTINFPPRKICIGCNKPAEFDEVKLSGRGKVYAYAIIARGATVYEQADEALIGGAFPVVLIELEEGLKIISQLTDCDPSEVEIGMEVEAVIRRVYEQDGIIRYGFKFRPVRFQQRVQK